MFASNVVKFNVSNEEVLRALREDDVKKSKKLASNITDKSPKEDEGVEHLGVLEAKTRIFGPWTEFSVIIGKDEIKFYRRPNVKVDPEDVGSSVDAKENEKSFGVASKFLDIKLPFKSIKCVWDWSFRLFYRNNRTFVVQKFSQSSALYLRAPNVVTAGKCRAKIVRALQKRCPGRVLSIRRRPLPSVFVRRIKIKCKKDSCEGWSTSKGGLCEIHRIAVTRNSYLDPRRNWVLDDAFPACQLCGILFSVFRRRHHCRRCGSLVCHDCSGEKMTLPELKSSGSVRICRRCVSLIRDSDSSNKSPSSRTTTTKKNASAVENKGTLPSDRHPLPRKTRTKVPKNTVVIRVPLPANATPGQLVEVRHVGRRYKVRIPEDAAIRGTGTFPARFPKHPLMKHKGEVRERSSIEVFDQEEEVMRLRIEDKTSDSSSSSDLSSASSFVASSTTPPPPPDDFCANKKKDSTFPCDHQRDSVFTQESKEWWTKIERERRESTARTKHMTLLRRAMLIGIRVFKYGRDGKACARYMWTDENFERICVTVARPTSVSRASRSKGVDVSNVIDICRGTGTEIFRRAFRKTEPSKTVQKRCFSFVLREPQKSVFKTMLAKSSLRASLDVEISDDVAEAALISRWLVAALSSQIGLPFDKDELGEEMYRAMDAHFTKHWGD